MTRTNRPGSSVPGNAGSGDNIEPSRSRPLRTLRTLRPQPTPYGTPTSRTPTTSALAPPPPRAAIPGTAASSGAAAQQTAASSATTAHGNVDGARRGPGRPPERSPNLVEHQDLMRGLNRELRASRRSDVLSFLCHLEDLDTSWSALAGQPGDLRPPLLEQAVNEGIAGRELSVNTRSAINTAFGLMLDPPTRPRVKLVPTLPEHKDLMKVIPRNSPQRCHLSRFLGHLERQSISWSTIAPAGNSCPPLLERAVNDGMAWHELNENTRATINTAFKLQLRSPHKGGLISQAPSAPAPAPVPSSQEHQTLLSNARGVTAPQLSLIGQFLCHLEQRGLSWSFLAQADDPRPLLLERAVNDGIAESVLDASTLSALNTAFGLELQLPAQ